jgi:hypothetical protein
MRTKSSVIVIASLVMVGWIAPLADAGKPFSSAPPFSSVPPSGSAISTAGQAYGLCATGVITQLTECVRDAAGDASAIAACKVAAATGAEACQDTFFSALSSAAQ